MLFLLPVAIPAANLPAGIHPVGTPARPPVSAQADECADPARALARINEITLPLRQ